MIGHNVESVVTYKKRVQFKIDSREYNSKARDVSFAMCMGRLAQKTKDSF